MVRTGGRAEALTRLLVASGWTPSLAPPRPQVADLTKPLSTEVLDLYRRLGGTQDDPAFRPGGWDLSFDGGLVVELDEELHFNRYRAATLETSWSSALPWRANYRSFCEEHERRCLQAGRWGKRWTNPSTARLFSGGEPGDLEAGAPRWKQRALYDSLKDLVPVLDLGIRIARVSIYDLVDGVAVEDILAGVGNPDPAALRLHVDSRTAKECPASTRALAEADPPAPGRDGPRTSV